MIEVKVRALSLTGYNGMAAATPVAKGAFMYKAGEFVAANAPLGTPGYSSLGDLRMLLADQYTHSGYGVFPVNKLILATEGADQDLDTIASGASLIYYVGGQYETDEYDITVSGTGTVAGTQLWLNGSGQIMTNAGADYDANYGLPPVGEVVSVSDFPATSKWFTGGTAGTYKKTVWYELYPWHAAPAGNAMFR